MSDGPITTFRGEFGFLSNFAPSIVSHDGIIYPTVEHAFQAAKTPDLALRRRIAAVKSPGDAKKAGRQLTLRPDWEQVKRNIMQELVLQKFALHRGLRGSLLATGDRQLVEGNTWGDTYWGVCNGVGENHLGEILVVVRELLR